MLSCNLERVWRECFCENNVLLMKNKAISFKQNMEICIKHFNHLTALGTRPSTLSKVSLLFLLSFCFSTHSVQAISMFIPAVNP